MPASHVAKMAQPQHQIQMPTPTTAFSPPQVSPSLPTPQPPYGMNHPSKRQKTSPGPAAQSPGSPYVSHASFVPSPASVATPPASAGAGSPPPFSIPMPMPMPMPNNNNLHSAPTTPQPLGNSTPQPPLYVNGNSQNGVGFNNASHPVPGLTMPGRLPGTPPVVTSPALPGPPALPAQPNSTTPLTPASAHPPYVTTNAMLAPMPTTPAPAGAMGPPSKPADRPAREVQYDVDDSLAGTGIDLREEEQFMAQFYAGTTRPEARTGFPINVPGGSQSFYGAGLANQAAQPASSQDQTQNEVQIAKATWQAAAARLGSVRSQEVKSPFTNIAVMHRRALKVAQEHGLKLILDPKTNNGMGKMRLDTEFQEPAVNVKTQIGVDGAVVNTWESWLPDDSFLAEQIGLLSIATKHRVRQLIEDADRIATTRQKTAHGAIPPEWADVAVSMKTLDASLSQGASPGFGNESAVSPLTNPLKRRASVDPKPDSQPGLSIAVTMREAGRSERDVEEARLRKRQKRAEDEERKRKGGDAASAAPSRAGSVAPGTPGPSGLDQLEAAAAAAAAPRQPTKKELKSKAMAQKAADMANTTTNTNRTTMAFLGGFGRKRKGKEYSWMTAGSGASTPNRMGGPGTPAATPGPKVAEVVTLTSDGRYRHGEFREDHDKGKNIQLRDWVAVLESDRLETRMLQQAYDRLDASSAGK